MPRFAATCPAALPQWEFLDRFAAAAADGFQGVEFLFPHAFAPEQLASAPTSERPATGAVQHTRCGTDRTSMQQAWAQVPEAGDACSHLVAAKPKAVLLWLVLFGAAMPVPSTTPRPCIARTGPRHPAAWCACAMDRQGPALPCRWRVVMSRCCCCSGCNLPGQFAPCHGRFNV